MDHPDQETEINLQYETEHVKPARQHSVGLYLAVLFGAAFVLLLMSYLMQLRSNEMTISGLRDSFSTIQSVDTLLVENQELHDQLNALRDKYENLEDEVQQKDTHLVQIEAELAAAKRLLAESQEAPTP